ncbi:gag-pol polyprotein [Tanacetum coccineum]|uniref:Gag-pol polyprotein n=1 Tax=Tanacetum coccineum TaxID=301880 RepID=A0ABQ4YCM9_9ASTR
MSNSNTNLQTQSSNALYNAIMEAGSKDRPPMLARKIYKPTNNNLRTSSNSSRANQDNSPRINKGTGYDNQKAINVAGARENVGTPVVQKSGIQCYNCKEYGHVSRECQKPK